MKIPLRCLSLLKRCFASYISAHGDFSGRHLGLENGSLMSQPHHVQLHPELRGKKYNQHHLHFFVFRSVFPICKIEIIDCYIYSLDIEKVALKKTFIQVCYKFHEMKTEMFSFRKADIMDVFCQRIQSMYGKQDKI